MLLVCIFVYCVVIVDSAFTCDELASSVSGACLSHLIESKGYINVDNEGHSNAHSDNKVAYREYYHDSISVQDSTQKLIPILLVHGGPGAPSMYMDTMKYLSCTAKYRVIFYDQLCVGMSSNTVNPKCNNISTHLPSLFTMRYYSNEMYAMIQNRIGSDIRYHLLGQSAGGLHVTQFAIHYLDYFNSGQVRSVIHANSVTHSIPQYLTGVTQEVIPSLPPKYAEILLNFDFEHAQFDEANNFFEMVHMIGLHEFPDCVVQALAGWHMEIYSALFAECEWCPANGEMGFTDLGDKIAEIKVPILAYRGGNDYIIEGILTEFKEKAIGSNVTLHTIKNAAHCTHIDHFDEWYEMIMQWLTFQDAAPSTKDEL